MRAQNLTISIPFKGCDKNCPYCVSKMSGMVIPDEVNMRRNIPKVKTLAKAAQVSSVLLTGKGEPLLNFADVRTFTQEFSEFPVEIQTNGRWLAKHIFANPIAADPLLSGPEGGCSRYMSLLSGAGLNVVSISIDNVDDPPYLKEMVKILHKEGLIVRVTFNITEKMRLTDFDVDIKYLTFDNFISQCQVWGVDQMTIRNICTPNNTESTKETQWILENTKADTYRRLKGEMKMACESHGFLVRNLPYGAKVYEYRGISVSFSDYCIQDNNDGEDIRSLIFLEDGGLYTSWNSKASRLF